jgi:hypothetical protein
MRLVRVPVEPPRVRVEDDGWDLDTQRRLDALMRAGLVEVKTVCDAIGEERRRG